jgi:hypothetical protein
MEELSPPHIHINRKASSDEGGSAMNGFVGKGKVKLCFTQLVSIFTEKGRFP